MFQLGFYEMLLVGILGFLLLGKDDFVKACFYLGKGLKSAKQFYEKLKADIKKETAPFELEDYARLAQKNAAEKEPLIKRDAEQNKDKA